MKLHEPVHTVADILRSHFDQYLQQFGPLPKHHYAIVNALMRCRTEEMGGHIYKCDNCDYELTLYNSCRNRHCTQCNAMARARWVDQRMEEALPIPYFHAVFTLPHQLNLIALRNKEVMYSILFKAVSETLDTLGNDPKRLNGEIGFILVLHTWGQALTDHPHIHCIIPAGALDEKKNVWRPTPENFLLPVAVMKKLFRAKFMDYFRKAIGDGTIKPLYVATEKLPTFNDLVNLLYTIDWVVYVKKPFASPANLIKYLSRYTHRVAIDNRRIISTNNNQVTFTYKDYSDGNKQKNMTVSSVEFIRRFMLHVLPDGFMRIRQYGFLSNKTKKEKLRKIKALISGLPLLSTTIATTPIPQIKELKIKEAIQCPCCEKGNLKKDFEIVPVIKPKRYYLVVND